jgi:heme-degrading monooxygenase HmoA
MHVAELNIGRARYPLDDPRMAGFMNALGAINAIADRSPGFVWRLADESGGMGNTNTKYTDDPQQIVNMSVWETAEALEHYVWNTAHKRIYNQKHSWFEKPAQAIFVMWPVAEGHIPTLDEALERLDHLRKHGSTDHAYGWDHLAHLKAWLTKQCG